MSYIRFARTMTLEVAKWTGCDAKGCKVSARDIDLDFPQRTGLLIQHNAVCIVIEAYGVIDGTVPTCYVERMHHAEAANVKVDTVRCSCQFRLDKAPKWNLERTDDDDNN